MMLPEIMDSLLGTVSKQKRLVQHAQRNAFAFIVVGTVGRSGLARMTLGSVAAAVVRHASCPVLVVPAAVPRPQHDRP